MTQKWEYLIEDDVGWSKTKIGDQKWETEIDYLNQRGREGWELVQGKSYQYPRYVFKRPITNE